MGDSGYKLSSGEFPVRFSTGVIILILMGTIVFDEVTASSMAVAIIVETVDVRGSGGFTDKPAS